MSFLADGYLPSGFSIFGLEIRFYAILILGGALFALFLAAFEARKKGFTWDFFTTVFVIAFPSGIIGARIWYVIASWKAEFANGSFWEVFKIWDGGLAIQGGAIAGILAGVLVVKFLRKGCPVLAAVDFAVPGILVAQAIGRWGNFFNHEVYGMVVNRSAWGFLPNFVLNQMVDSASTPNFIDVPLFLVESIINICSYLLIRNLLIPIMEKHHAYRYGDGFCFYFITYGAVRAMLEPMRNPQFIMGTNTQASFVMAIIFIIVGAICIILNHILPKYIKIHKENVLE